MARAYDNWERLVQATLLREELRLIGQRTPSDVSLASSSSASFSLTAANSSRLVSTFNFKDLSLVGEAFEYQEILRSTDYFSKSNLIKKGRSGYLFRGILQDKTKVVVKRVDSSSFDKGLFLVSELNVFGKVSYRRLVPLLGHCLENGDDKFLVYKYMPNLDLSSALYREINVANDDGGLPSLDWITRLKIATQTADALCYLHHDCVPPLVHGDVQASSILLDYRYEVRLGSLSEASSNQRSNPREPEQRTSGYDVYCFGKVLLELVTGKLGVSAAPADAAGIKNWMEETLLNISATDMETMERIVDPTLVMYEDLLQEVWGMAVVAKACLNPSPSKRPTMRYVLSALEDPLSVVIEAYSHVPPIVKLREEDEDLRLNLSATLYSYNEDRKQWIKRGTGNVKILRHKEIGKFRVLMRESKTLNICANHLVLATTKVLQPQRAGYDNCCVWHAADCADGEVKNEVFCLRFASLRDCKTFAEMVRTIADELNNSRRPNSVVTEECSDLPEQLASAVKLKEDDDEEQRLNLNANLYLFDKDGDKFIEAGPGNVAILKHKKTGKFRVVIRGTLTHKICVNHPVDATVKVKQHSGNGKACVWHAGNSADGEIKDEKFYLKFASAEDCKTFMEMVQNIADWLRVFQSLRQPFDKR